MRRIRIQNPLIDHTYKSYLGADYAVADGTAVTFISNNSFAANDQLIFGEPREELAELKKLNSVSGATSGVIASALKFAHQKGTSIYRVIWDQVAIEADYGSGFAIITTSAIQWDNAGNETVYYDPNGTNATSYRFRFYNTVTLAYSEYSPTLTGATPARNTVGYMLEQIRLIAGDRERKIVQDEELIRVLNRAQDIVYSYNSKWWFLKVDTEKANNGISATTPNTVYSLASYTNLGHLARLKYRYTSGSLDYKYDLKYKGELEFDSINWNYNQPQFDYPEFYKMLPADSSSTKGYFQIDSPIKTNSIGIFYPVYYEKMTDLDTVDDTTQIPLPAILEDYGISYVFSLKGNETKAAQYMNQFLGPADSQEKSREISGIKLLQELDKQQRGGVGQPRSLVAYKGRLGTNNFMGNYTGRPGTTRDYLRENFF